MGPEYSRELKLPSVVGFLNKQSFDHFAIASFFPEVREWVEMWPAMPLGPEALVTWGYKGKLAGDAIAYSRQWNVPLIVLEDGFVRSNGLGVDGVPPISISADDLGIFYDARRPSRLETLLGTAGPLTGLALERARETVRLFREYRLTKYNLPFEPWPADLPPKDFVLVVDQTRGDLSVKLGAGDGTVFDRMVSAALDENPGAKIVVKTHPDVVVGKRAGYIDIKSLSGVCQVLTANVDPAELFARTRRMYTVTSQLGFEALFHQATVDVFGAPFYSGWGLTVDRCPITRRTRKLSLEELADVALNQYCRYRLPHTRALARSKQAFRHIARERDRRTRAALRLKRLPEIGATLKPSANTPPPAGKVLQSLTELVGIALRGKQLTRLRRRTLLRRLCDTSFLEPSARVRLIEWSAAQAFSSGDAELAYELLKGGAQVAPMSPASKRLHAKLALRSRSALEAEGIALSLLSSDASDAVAFDILIRSYKRRMLHNHVVLASARRFAAGLAVTPSSFRAFVMSVCRLGKGEEIIGRLRNIAPKSVDDSIVAAEEIRLAFDCRQFDTVIASARALGSELFNDFTSTLCYLCASFATGQHNEAGRVIAQLDSRWPARDRGRIPLALIRNLDHVNEFEAVARILDQRSAERDLTARERCFLARARIGTGRPQDALEVLRDRAWPNTLRDEVTLLEALALSVTKQPKAAARLLDDHFRFSSGPLAHAHHASLHYLDAGMEQEAQDIVAAAWQRLEQELTATASVAAPGPILEFLFRRRCFGLLEWLFQRVEARGVTDSAVIVWQRRVCELQEEIGPLVHYANSAAAQEVVMFAPNLARMAGIVLPSPGYQITSATNTSGPVVLGVSNLFSSGAHDDLRLSRRFLRNLCIAAEAENFVVHPVSQWRGNDRFLAGDIGRVSSIRPKLTWHSYGSGPNCYHVKDAALTGYFTVDTDGYAGWSTFAKSRRIEKRIQATSSIHADEHFAGLFDTYVKSNRSKYKQTLSATRFRAPYVFLALQVIDDTVALNAFIPQLEFASAVIDWADGAGHHIVVKRHPRCQDYRMLEFLNRAAQRDHVTITQESIHSIIPDAQAVFTVNSGVGVEALLHLKRVYMAGSAEYMRCGRVLRTIEEVRRISLTEDEFPSAEYIKKFLYVYCNVFACRHDDLDRMRKRLAAFATYRRRQSRLNARDRGAVAPSSLATADP